MRWVLESSLDGRFFWGRTWFWTHLKCTTVDVEAHTFPFWEGSGAAPKKKRQADHGLPPLFLTELGKSGSGATLDHIFFWRSNGKVPMRM